MERKGGTNTTGVNDCVSASSITPGPSLKEKVDAADRDHTDVTEPLAEAVATVFELTAREKRVSGKWKGWIQRPSWHFESSRQDEDRYGTSSPNQIALAHLHRLDEKGTRTGHKRLPEHGNMPHFQSA
jgi:hypothetical protein